MNATIDKYPQFEANQVLTSDQLNILFGYNDEQNRLTRTNLLGIGIVCGLEIQTKIAGTILLSRGCVVTSEGYLITLDKDFTFIATRNYESPKEVAYQLFRDDNGQKFQLWELLESLPIGDSDPSIKTLLTSPPNFLSDKVVMLFVELNKKNNKNCLPNSCDDTGTTIGITIKPLLILKSEADKIKNAKPIVNYTKKLELPVLQMPQHKLASNTITTDQVLNIYKNILTKAFVIDKIVANLQNLIATYNFLNLPSFDFSKLTNLYPNNATQLSVSEYYYQYYYDFIADLISTYNEIKDVATPILAACCPDSLLFPKHIFVSEAVNVPNPSSYRHYFIPSPIFASEKERVAEIKFLFDRLQTMILAFGSIEVVKKTGTIISPSTIKITPSQLRTPLSDKSIPHYYNQNLQSNGKRMHDYWDFAKSRENKGKLNLSYRANEYAAEDFVRFPLNYDLEAYNFLNIDGHLGKNYKTAIQELTSLRNNNQLPFDVVAVKTGNNPDLQNLAEFECHFDDLEASFNILKAEIKNDAKITIMESTLGVLTQTTINGIGDSSGNGVKNELQALFNTYNNRKSALYKQFLLSNFIQKHPGLQHKAGVTVGGTFVMVYHGSYKAIMPTFDLSQFVDVVDVGTTKKFVFKESAVKSLNIDKNSSALIKTLAENLDATKEGNQKILEDSIKTVQKGTLAINPAIKLPLFDLPRELQSIPIALTEGIVFADFYLPYVCCSDCPPIQYLIQEPLTISAKDATCSEDATGFEVEFNVSGGLPPYTYFIDSNAAAAKTVVGSLFIEKFINSSTPKVTVKDAKGNVASIMSPTKNCCNLPCDGKAVRCKYLPWMPKPVNNRDKVLLASIETATLKIFDESGATIIDENYADEISAIYSSSSNIVRTNNYDKLMADIFEAINQKVTAKLGNNKFGIEYIPNRNDTGFIQIEHLSCYKFEFNIKTGWSDQKKIQIDYTYSSEGIEANLIHGRTKYNSKIPKFGCIELDKCNGNLITKNDCTLSTRDFQVVQENPSTFKIVEGVEGISRISALWITEMLPKVYYTEKEISLETTLALKVRLLVTDDKGCWSYQEFLKTEIGS